MISSKKLTRRFVLFCVSGQNESAFHQYLIDTMNVVQCMADKRHHNLKVESMCIPHCTRDKFWDTLRNSGARSFGLFDDLMSFFDTMNVYSTTQENISNIKEYQDFLELFRGRPKLRENSKCC